MNSRDYKRFRPEQWYHLYNRGHNKELVFLDDQDFKAFGKRLAFILSLRSIGFKTQIRPLPKDCFTIMAYCFMPNHYHILIRQNTEISIAVLMSKLCTSYAKYFNARYNKIGNVFQDTFKAKCVENDSYLTYLSAYIHNNPENPFEYEHSSIHEYLDPKNVQFCEINILLKYFDLSPDKYKDFVANYNFNQHQKIQHLSFED